MTDYQEIMHYWLHVREEIFSSIFPYSYRKDMHIPKSTVNEHFKNTNKTVVLGGNVFLKKLEMI